MESINKLKDKLHYGNNKEKKFIKILKSVKLKLLKRESVLNMFKVVLPYLVEKEDYETAAQIKEIETEYLKK